jgi:hypothetical protein
MKHASEAADKIKDMKGLHYWVAIGALLYYDWTQCYPIVDKDAQLTGEIQHSDSFPGYIVVDISSDHRITYTEGSCSDALISIEDAITLGIYTEE